MKAKYSLWLRCVHWINVPVLSLMVWSGLMIYWANVAYPIFFPDSFFEFFQLNARLAEGMAIHFAVAWIFVGNGLVYLSWFFYSGHWREVLPERATWRDLVPTVLHDMGIRKTAPPFGLYNAAQRLAYTGAIFLGVVAVMSGFAIYKPVQLTWLRSLFFGYEGARLAHFVAMMGLVLFVFVHLVQVARAGFKHLRAMVSGFEHGPAWKSFLCLGIFFALFTGGWALVNRDSEDDNIPRALRVVHEWNGKIWSKFYSNARPTSCVAPKNRPPIRENGDLGLTAPLDLPNWKLEVIAEGQGNQLFTMNDIHSLPRVELETEFRCIEGWSTPISYAGVRFSDFLKRLKAPFATYQYVGLATPGGAYYVSVDIESMLHPDTVLAYEMNGAPLTSQHGAPLRLVIPVKYGIKSLKRIGKIFLSNTRPPDYWAEQGYDWHSGL